MVGSLLHRIETGRTTSSDRWLVIILLAAALVLGGSLAVIALKSGLLSVTTRASP